MFVRDYREAAKQGDTFADFRALTLFRWKVTGPVAVVLALLVALAHGCLPAAPARCGHRAAVLGRAQPDRPHPPTRGTRSSSASVVSLDPHDRPAVGPIRRSVSRVRLLSVPQKVGWTGTVRSIPSTSHNARYWGTVPSGKV